MLYPTLNEFLVQGSRNTPFLKEKTTVKIVKTIVNLVKMAFFVKFAKNRNYRTPDSHNPQFITRTN